MSEEELEKLGRVLRWCVSEGSYEAVSWGDIGDCCGISGSNAMSLLNCIIPFKIIFLPLILEHIAKRGVV